MIDKQADGVINGTAMIVRGCPADDKSTSSSSGAEGCSPVTGTGNLSIRFRTLTSINDVTVLGGGHQGFCDNSTKALVIKSLR